MAATVLCLAVFVYLSFVGYAVLSLLSDEIPLFRLLLAPAVGATTVMLPTFLLNEIGIPIKYVAMAVVLVTLAAALTVLWVKGRRIPIGDFWPYALLILFGLFMTGWPMLKFGFDWVSYCNDDMANYCMGAERVLHYGYYQPPDARALAGEDYTQYLWYLHVLHRPGSEMVLALVSSLTRLSPLQIFMPTILAFMLCQISAAGAMAYAAIRSKLAVWITMLLMAASALVALGSLYQLIAQVIGLALLAGLVSVLMRPIEELMAGAWVRRGMLIGLLTAGVIFAYSEVIPFAVVGYALYALITWRSWKTHPRAGLAVLGTAVAVVVILLNRFLAFAVVYVLGQASRVPSEDPLTTLFPYYMMPAGPMYFWGIFPLGKGFPDDFWLSLMIAGGLVMSALVGVLVFRSALRKNGSAVIGLVMSAVFLTLFLRHVGFGMYKLAMYLQPFILAALVVEWMSLWRWRIVQVVPLLVLCLLGLRTHLFYVRVSGGEGHGTFSEIPRASETHLVREYAALLAAHPGRPLELDSYNLVLAKFQMLESRGRAATFPSGDFLHNFGTNVPKLLIAPTLAERGREVSRDYRALFPTRKFDTHARSPVEPDADQFVMDLMASHAGSSTDPWLFVGMTGQQAPFNRWRDPEDAGSNFRAGDLDAFSNHLIFVVSELGESYYVQGRKNVAVYQLEPDPKLPGRSMAGMGRYLLFQVVEPTRKARVEIDLTDSLAGDRQNRLPPAEVIGQTRTPLRMVGRGSARVFSDPIEPQMIDGRPFICLDMGTDGTYFNYQPTGLLRLWGRDVSIDHRQMVAFLRDVSLVSDSDYQAIDPPTGIQNFPQDVMNRNLLYSGIYEDAWVSDRAFLILAQPPGAARLVCRMTVPRIADDQFSTEIAISVDGKELARKRLNVGEHELSVELPTGGGHRRVDLSFSKFQRLPDPDGRPVGAELARIAIEPSSPAPSSHSEK